MPTWLLLAPPDFQTFRRPYFLKGRAACTLSHSTILKKQLTFLLNLKPKNSENIIIRLCIGVIAHMLLGTKVNLGYVSSFESRISLNP